MNLVDSLGRAEAGERRLRILRYLAAERIPVAVPWVYAASGGNLADLQRLAELELILLGESEIWRDPLENIILTPAEAPAVDPRTGRSPGAGQSWPGAGCGRPKSAALPAARRDRLRQDRNLPAGGSGMPALGAAGHHPGAGNRPDPADRAAFPQPLPRPGGSAALAPLRGRALRYLAAGPARRPAHHRRAALSAVCPAAEPRPDRAG